MKLVYPLSSAEIPGINELGGKALSLIRMTQAGFPVPPGFVLTTAFFAPWMQTILSSPEWAAVNGNSASLGSYAALKAVAEKLPLDKTQKEIVRDSLAQLKKESPVTSYAVRSSAPQEDLEGASFAGGYQTSLGVTTAELETALRKSFASALDRRVFVYKREHGLDLSKPAMAIIVQAQLNSTLSGVAFSLNPLNNCYDEAVINANFGLGESVVSGQVSPDQFVVDKLSLKILGKKLGKKETAFWALKTGGIREKPPNNQAVFCLSEEQARDITQMVSRVETFYQKPMDIEWAIAEAKLYLLQTRPVTAYFPLPKEMLTEPGAERYLYNDRLLSKQGIEEPLSVMGLEAAAYTESEITKRMMGREVTDNIKDEFFAAAGGKMYNNVSNYLKLSGKKSYLWAAGTVDTLVAEIVSNLNKGEYVRKKPPRRLKGSWLKMLYNSRGLIKSTVKAIRKPALYHKQFRKGISALEADLTEAEKEEATPKQFAHTVYAILIHYIMSLFLGGFAAAEYARFRLKGLFKRESPQIKAQVVKLEQALPHNVTIEMGLSMYNLANSREIKESANTDEFSKKLGSAEYSPRFQTAWERFMEQYGFRCPKELDLATPRFSENIADFFRQLKMICGLKEQNPQQIYDHGVAQRERTFEALKDILKQRGKRAVKRYMKYYTILVTFGGYRELPKYYWIKVLGMVRGRVLKAGRLLVEEERLDSVEQVFDLKMEQLDLALRDQDYDPRGAAKINTKYLEKLKQVRQFPRMIDSRGKILYAPQKAAKPGEIAGDPIAPGLARGRIKVLHSPHEKPVLPGEILVARATDPGWTPLFINARGILLEVGGLLQHGALVAREYCKPCIAGIESVTTRLKDGQEVEMDGSTGIVRILAETVINSE